MSRHGMVKAVGTHFEYEDGTVFYPFGTTIYALTHQEESIIEETLNTLRNSPFNKAPIVLMVKHLWILSRRLCGGLKAESSKGRVPNVSAF